MTVKSVMPAFDGSTKTVARSDGTPTPFTNPAFPLLLDGPNVANSATGYRAQAAMRLTRP